MNVCFSRFVSLRVVSETRSIARDAECSKGAPSDLRELEFFECDYFRPQ